MKLRQIKVLQGVLRDQRVRKPVIIWAMILTVLLAILETAGLGMLLPLLTFVEKGPAAIGGISGPVGLIAAFVKAIGLPVTFATLTVLTITPLVLRQVVMYVRLLVVADITHRGTQALRRRAIDAALRADLRFFIDRKHGDFPNAMLTEPQNATSIAYVGIGILLHVLMCAAYFTMLFYVSWQLTVFVVPIVLAVGLVVRRYSGQARDLTLDVKNQSAALYQQVSESVRGIRQIRMRVLEDETAARLGELIDRILSSRLAFERAKAIVDSGGPFILTLGIFLLMYLAVTQMNMQLAALGFFLFVLMRLQQVVTQLNQDRLSFVRLLVSVDHVRDFIADAGSRPAVKGGTTPFALHRQLCFEDVYFHYGSDRKDSGVLNGLSFKIEADKTVAIVGRSGAGKSTTVDLILRNYVPQKGAITVDGSPIEQFDLASLRRGIGVVTQDTFLFHETVRDNLCMGLDPAPADDKLWACLQQANAVSFVRALPNELDTILGEGGTDLSGGQRQRLSLARALVQEPTLLVLDEPTSALDSETEAAIQDTLDDLHGSLTILVIAHRLTTISKADRILVMDGGRVIGEGNHRGLLDSDPMYRRLFERQAL